MNQQDDSVTPVTPSQPISAATSPSMSAMPEPQASPVPTSEAGKPLEGPVDVSHDQIGLDSQAPDQESTLPTPTQSVEPALSPAQVDTELAGSTSIGSSVQAPLNSVVLNTETPEPIQTIPMPVQEKVIDDVATQEQPDALQPASADSIEPIAMPQASPVDVIASASPTKTPSSMPSISMSMPQSQIDEPSTIDPSKPIESEPSLPSQSEVNASSPEPLDLKTPSQDAASESRPVVIEATSSENPEPLPSPLTPPPIKTTPPAPSSSQNISPTSPISTSTPPTEPQSSATQPTPVMVKGAGKYQIRVINEKCIGAASCVAVAPKAFKLNEQQIAEVLSTASEESDENLLLSAQSCPTMAIEIIDSETGKKVWPR